MNSKNTLVRLLSVLIIFGVLTTACGAPATEAPAPTEAPPVATEAPATEAPRQRRPPQLKQV